MAKIKKERIFKELLNPNFGYFYKISETLYKGKTDFQKIELVNTPEFGTVLLLDDITQVALKNDWQYHEPMVHPALCSHPSPKNILVIGGGDGGILKEVLKHPSVKNIDFAELDEGVINFSKKYLSDMNQHSFDDPRVKIHVTDGRKFVEKQKNTYDIVIMDMTDPFGPSKFLYTREFFRAVKKSLRNDKGIFVMHSESPIVRPVAYNCIIKTLQKVFTNVQPIFTYIQMYSVLWSIALSSDSPVLSKIKASTINKRLDSREIKGLHVFNGETFEAMRIEYPYIKEISKQKGQIITDKNPDFPDHFE